MTAAGIAARCGRAAEQCTHTALGGCAWFCRVPGADDRLTPPAGWTASYLGEVWREMVAAALATEAMEHG